MDNRNEPDSGPPSRNNSIFERPSYVAILPLLLLYFCALFGCAPLLPQIHIDQVCREMNEDDCDSSAVSGNASNVGVVAAISMNVAALFSCGIFGAIVDKYGRKVAVICPLIGMFLLILGYLFITVYNPSYYLYIVIVVNFIMGVSGSYITFIMACMCYTSDSTMAVPEQRIGAYTLAEAAVFSPQTFAPILSGLWAQYYGFDLPLLCGCSLCLLGLLYCYIVPESLPPKAQSRKEPLKVDPIQTFRHLKVMLEYKTSEGKSPLPFLLVAFFLYFACIAGETTTRLLYMKHTFGWDSLTIGVYDGIVGLVVTTSMLATAATFNYIGFQIPTISWIQIGYMLRALNFVGIAVAPNTLVVFLCIGLLLFVGSVVPYTRTIISNSVPFELQATAFSAFSATEGLATLFAPIFGVAYSVLVVSGVERLVWIFMAVFCLTSFLIILYVRTASSVRMNLPNEKQLHKIKSDASFVLETETGWDVNAAGSYHSLSVSDMAEAPLMEQPGRLQDPLLEWDEERSSTTNDLCRDI